MLDEIENSGVQTVGHVPNSTCHGDVCDDQIPVKPGYREGFEYKLNVEAREAERFTGGKEQGKQPTPSSQACLHLAERVLNHPPSPLRLHGRTTLLQCPLDHREAGSFVSDCKLSLGSLVEDRRCAGSQRKRRLRERFKMRI